MAAVHHFEASVRWRKGAEGVATSNHRLEFARNRSPIEASAAPQYKGDPAKLNPEELFVASLVSCQMLSYLALASRAGVDVLAYEDRGEGTLTIADKRMRFTEVRLRPRIAIAPGGDVAKAQAVVDAAHDACFIANSVSCAVVVEPEITVGG
jgi:organic hydroperoxide reductase OsmC/OhrA